jgi:hypothetical protein
VTALLAPVAGFLDDVLRCAALGALLGQALALRGQRRSPGYDAFAQVAKWTLFGAAIGASLGLAARV